MVPRGCSARTAFPRPPVPRGRMATSAQSLTSESLSALRWPRPRLAPAFPVPMSITTTDYQLCCLTLRIRPRTSYLGRCSASTISAGSVDYSCRFTSPVVVARPCKMRAWSALAAVQEGGMENQDPGPDLPTLPGRACLSRRNRPASRKSEPSISAYYFCIR